MKRTSLQSCIRLYKHRETLYVPRPAPARRSRIVCAPALFPIATPLAALSAFLHMPARMFALVGQQSESRRAVCTCRRRSRSAFLSARMLAERFGDGEAVVARGLLLDRCWRIILALSATLMVFLICPSPTPSATLSSPATPRTLSNPVGTFVSLRKHGISPSPHCRVPGGTSPGEAHRIVR